MSCAPIVPCPKLFGSSCFGTSGSSQALDMWIITTSGACVDKLWNFANLHVRLYDWANFLRSSEDYTKYPHDWCRELVQHLNFRPVFGPQNDAPRLLPSIVQRMSTEKLAGNTRIWWQNKIHGLIFPGKIPLTKLMTAGSAGNKPPRTSIVALSTWKVRHAWQFHTKCCL